jgi:hypothetical protein
MRLRLERKMEAIQKAGEPPVGSLTISVLSIAAVVIYGGK